MAKVLIIGSGGREHALAWSLSRSEQVEQVYVANGNGGTQWEANDGQGLNPRAPSQNINIPAKFLAQSIVVNRAVVSTAQTIPETGPNNQNLSTTVRIFIVQQRLRYSPTNVRYCRIAFFK